MIKSAKNSFQDGLIMDIAPDNTGATYMTNALNATLITNNGNEMSLQNDMGNGRVETAFLPEGYIPVGTCEYGDIIYIASYNPIIDKSQIGSFPSPERNISSDEIGGINLTLTSGDFLDINNGMPTGKLIANSVKKILCDKYLHPGDKFLIIGNNIKSDEKEKDNSVHLSDYGSGKQLHDYFPKDIKIYVVSIEDSGKIVYLDNVKWNGDYYINNVVETTDSSTWDVDSYREDLASNYTVFNSKVSGKLALLIELERINGFSCSWFPVVNGNEYTIYWSFNWSTDNFNINPAGYLVKFNETNLTYGKYETKTVALNKLFQGNQSMTETSLDIANLDLKQEETFSSTYYSLIKNTDGKESYTDYDVEKLKQSYDYNDGDIYFNNYEYYASKTDTGENVIYSNKYEDNVVNNHFGKSIIKRLGIFNFGEDGELRIISAEDSNVILETKKIPHDLSKTILNYTVIPYMRYGYLEDLAQTGQIDFSKIGTKHIELHTWKYYNFDNTLTLTWGMDGYTEPTRDITEVVFNFYDNTGLVATYVTKDKKSYNGVFTEYLTLNSQNPSHKLTYEIDVNGEPKMLESSKLYLVKILIKYRERNLDGTYKEDNTGDITEYRWIWTNSMYNEYYHQIKDFNDLKFELNLDLAVLYSLINATPLDTTVLYEGKKNSEITEEDNYYKHLKANITYNLDEGPNIQAVVNPGLVNTYDTFRLNENILEQPIYVVVGDKTITYEPNQPQTFNDTKFINGEYLKPTEVNLKIINKTLSELLGTTLNDLDDYEINSGEEYYKKYNDYFEFVLTKSVKGHSWSSNEKELYLKHNLKTASLSSLNDLDTSTYTLKNVYLINTYTNKDTDTYQPIQFTMNEILYSKFYEIVQSKVIDSILVKPLIYKTDDLIKYNLNYDNDNSNFNFNNIGAIALWKDGSHKIRYWKYNLSISKFESLIAGKEASDYNLNQGHQLNLYDVQETGSGLLCDVFPGITPIILGGEDDGDNPENYIFNNLSLTYNSFSFDSKFGPNTTRAYVLLAIADTLNNLHLTNDIFPYHFSYLDVIKQIVSLLSQLYYTNGEVLNIPDYKSVIDMVYLSPHSIQLSADVIFKIESIKTANAVFNIGNVKLHDYLTDTYANSNIDSSDVKADNVTPTLNRIIKNCPIHFKYLYILPEFIDSGNPKYIVKCSDGTDFYTNKGLINNKLYWIDDEELKTPNSEFEYWGYETVKINLNSDTFTFTFKKDELENPFNNENIYGSFVVYNDQLRCLRSNSNVVGHVLKGKEYGTSSRGELGPIDPKETLLGNKKI